MNLQKVVVKAERGHVVKKKGNVKTFFFSHHANETKDIYTALTEVPDLRIDPTMKTISLAKGGAPLVLIDGIPKSHSLASISPAMIDKVEVSNSVPLEYMGQGYSGVVNIITKNIRKRADTSTWEYCLIPSWLLVRLMQTSPTIRADFLSTPD